MFPGLFLVFFRFPSVLSIWGLLYSSRLAVTLQLKNIIVHVWLRKDKLRDFEIVHGILVPGAAGFKASTVARKNRFHWSVNNESNGRTRWGYFQGRCHRLAPWLLFQAWHAIATWCRMRCHAECRERHRMERALHFLLQLRSSVKCFAIYPFYIPFTKSYKVLPIVSWSDVFGGLHFLEGSSSFGIGL